MDHMFDALPITEVVIPDKVGTIYAYAFKNCNKLEKVIFENNKKNLYFFKYFLRLYKLKGNCFLRFKYNA